MRTRSLISGLATLIAAFCTGASTLAQATLQLNVAAPCTNAATLSVTIDLTASTLPISGGQYFLQYDTARLQFLGADPSAPFPTIVFSASNTMAGTIDFATGIDFSGAPAGAPARMATLRFAPLADVCASENRTLVSFRPHPLPPTRVTDSDGTPIVTATVDLAPFTIDHAPPTVTPPVPVVVSTDPHLSNALVTLTPPSTMDNCGPVTTVGTRSDMLPLSAPYPLGPTTVTWTATDCAGNATVVYQTVTVIDTEAPIIDNCGMDQSAVAGAGCLAATPDFTSAVLAHDNVSAPANLTITQSPPAGTPQGIGPHMVTIFVTDEAMNTATCLRTFTVVTNLSPPTGALASTPSYCAGSVSTITLSASGGTGTTLHWYSGSCGGSSIGTGSPLPIAAPSSTTTYFVRWESDCGATSCAQIAVNVTPPPTASAGGPYFICADGVASLLGAATNYATVQWTTGGDGSFADSSSPHAVYIPGAGDITAGTVSLTLTAQPNSPCSVPAVSTTTVTIQPLPTAPTSASVDHDNYCSTSVSTVTLSAHGGTGKQLRWSTSCGGPTIGTGSPLTIAAPLTTTTYYAVWVNPCGSSACTALTVHVNPITGACCSGWGTQKICTVVAPGNCTGPTSPTHAFRGDCTLCGFPFCCGPDYNNSGAIDVQDIFDFLSDWFLQVPSSDFNHDGFKNVQDIFDFLAAWFVGCP